ncbi:putative membrane-associated, eicosanoid/glutathione metabolism (MAPEG) protein [Septoria linicola]|nr:putative membrane-associated, eicosanoid/glutathione metabolism (MAPEG) protein [Septoria linicola]
MASYIPDLTRDNISLYTIPLYWVISIFPRFYGATLYEAKTKEKMDTRTPRGFVKQAGDSQKLDQASKDLISRTEAAVANSFENFGPFTAAVVAGSAAKLDPLVLNSLTFVYLGSRVLYSVLYINSTTLAVAKARSAAYVVGLGCLFTMFVQAGTRFKNAVL